MKEKLLELSIYIKELSNKLSTNDEEFEKFLITENIFLFIVKNYDKISFFKKMYKFPFYIKKEDFEKIEISKIPISISKFTYILNNSISEINMKKIKARDITNWLLKNEYLRIVENGNYRITTETGKNIGIMHEEKENLYGNKYFINLYNEGAQKFILEHLNLIIKDIDENYTLI